MIFRLNLEAFDNEFRCGETLQGWFQGASRNVRSFCYRVGLGNAAEVLSRYYDVF
jgi:hypothetical protein